MSFVDAHDFSVDLVLRVLGIPASTYYDWRARQAEPSRRAREDAELLAMIDEIRGEHEFAATYGSPRVWLELRNRGVKVGRKRVERIMRVNGRQGAYLRKGWKHGSTRQNPRHTAAPDLLGRDFTATAPNQKWVADLTRILTGEGILWLASVRDAFANKVVGWDSGPRATTELVLSALDYAIWSRDVRDGQLIHHSDYAEVCVKPRIGGDGLCRCELLVDSSA
jgi:putative transposase